MDGGQLFDARKMVSVDEVRLSYACLIYAGGILQAARQAPPSNAGSLPRSSVIKSFRDT